LRPTTIGADYNSAILTLQISIVEILKTMVRILPASDQDGRTKATDQTFKREVNKWHEFSLLI
jgi:hypothetical protein